MPKWRKAYFLTDDCLHGCSVLGSGVVSVELIGYRRMILTILLNGFLHETGEGGQHVDGRVDLLVVQLSIDEDLSFSDVASEIGNGMRDVVVLSGSRLTGMERMGIWVMDPFLPWTLPARS